VALEVHAEPVEARPLAAIRTTARRDALTAGIFAHLDQIETDA